MQDLKYQQSKTCARCGRVAVPTPFFDYYETPLFPKGEVCEDCLKDLIQRDSAPIKPKGK